MWAWPGADEGERQAADAVLHAVVDDDDVLLVLGERLPAGGIEAMRPVRRWLTRQHCTNLLVDATAVSATAPNIVDELVQLAQLVRIGGGTAVVIAESAVFAAARTTADVTRTLDRATGRTGVVG